MEIRLLVIEHRESIIPSLPELSLFGSSLLREFLQSLKGASVLSQEREFFLLIQSGIALSDPVQICPTSDTSALTGLAAMLLTIPNLPGRAETVMRLAWTSPSCASVFQSVKVTRQTSHPLSRRRELMVPVANAAQPRGRATCYSPCVNLSGSLEILLDHLGNLEPITNFAP